MKRNFLISLTICMIYFVVDVTYQVFFAMAFSNQQYTNAGIREIFTEVPNYLFTIPLFFILITAAIKILAVNPSLKEEKSVRNAVLRALLLGVSVYGTLAMVSGWSLKDYPAIMMWEITLEGVLFAPISAGLTTWLFTIKSKK